MLVVVFFSLLKRGFFS